MTETSQRKSYVVGNNPVYELLRADPGRVDWVRFKKGRRDKNIDRILALCREKNVPFFAVAPEELDRLFDGNHQGVVARIAALDYAPLEALAEAVQTSPLPLIVALDKVQDPGNVGVLARTVYAMGGAGIIVGRHGGAYLGPAAVKASSGALARLPVAQVTNLTKALDFLAACGLTVCGAAQEEGALNALADPLPLPSVLVLGNEEKGLRPGVAQACPVRVSIPFARPFDSLNVAQAGAVLVAAFARCQG